MFEAPVHNCEITVEARWFLTEAAANQIHGLSHKHLRLFAQKNGVRLLTLKELLLAIRQDGSLLGRLRESLHADQRDRVETAINQAAVDNALPLQQLAARLADVISGELSHNENIVGSILSHLTDSRRHLQFIAPLVSCGWWQTAREVNNSRHTQCRCCSLHAMPSRVLWDVKEAARALDVSNLGWPLLDAWLAGSNLELYKQVRGPPNTTGRLPARVRNLLWRCCWLAHCFDTVIRDTYLRVLVLASLEPPDIALVVTLYAEGHDAFELFAGHWVDRLARSCMLQLPCQDQCIRSMHADRQWTEDHVLKPHFMNKVVFEEIVATRYMANSVWMTVEARSGTCIVRTQPDVPRMQRCSESCARRQSPRRALVARRVSEAQQRLVQQHNNWHLSLKEYQQLHPKPK